VGKTGFIVRIQRDSLYVAVPIDDLTDAELDAFLIGLKPEAAVHWAKALAGWIRDHATADQPGRRS
jgi:hypothetical protein